MRAATSAGFVAIGVLVLWAALTGRLACLTDAWRCVVAGPGAAAGGAGVGAAPAAGGGELGRLWRDVLGQATGARTPAGAP